MSSHPAKDLQTSTPRMPGCGTVYLVGAGPGDPGLLSVRAAQLIATCDCLVHDSLVNPEILAMAPDGTQSRDVGKRGGTTSITQEQINQLLITLAHSRSRVVRLKGGDPFLFGRGGEEAAALAAAGIPFEVVPGVTSGIGVPAYAGIPVTHRAASSVVAFATGHQAKDRADEAELDWASLARIETVVLYMGMHRLQENCAAMMRHGRAGDTPAAAIQWGSYARQKVVVGTLDTLPRLAKEAGLGAPAITVIGEVVRYRDKIRWFDNRPLSGRRILVTRSRDSASELTATLRSYGAQVLEAPLAKHLAVEDPSELDAALDRLAMFDWVVFTSANAVRFVWARLHERGQDARAFGGVKLAVVGSATATALHKHGLRADLVPESYNAAALGRELRTRGLHCVGNIPPTPALPRVLLPHADNARPNLHDFLVGEGCPVTSVTAYRTLAVPFELPRHGEADALDAVTFASSATVDRFIAAVGKSGCQELIAAGCRLIAIGPQTAATLLAYDLPVSACAEQATVAGLAQAVLACLAPAG